MEEQIKKLHELALDWCEWALSVKQPDGLHTYDTTTVYFNDFGKTKSVDFDNDKCGISFINNKFECKVDATAEYLKQVIKTSREELVKSKAYYSEVHIQKNEEKRAAEIKKLEEKLEQLKKA